MLAEMFSYFYVLPSVMVLLIPGLCIRNICDLYLFSFIPEAQSNLPTSRPASVAYVQPFYLQFPQTPLEMTARPLLPFSVGPSRDIEGACL